MSRYDEIFANIGRETATGGVVPSVQAGDPEQAPQGQRFKLTKVAIIKALEKMPDEAALWSPAGYGEYDAKNAMRDELWKLVERKVQAFMYAPDGKTLLEVK